jgi:hypothetical protein
MYFFSSENPKTVSTLSLPAQYPRRLFGAALQKRSALPFHRCRFARVSSPAARLTVVGAAEAFFPSKTMGAGASTPASPAKKVPPPKQDSPELQAALALWLRDPPPVEDYEIVFEEWGKLGITFRDNLSRSKKYQAIVVCLFDKAAELGVRLGSLLLEVNGQSMEGLEHKTVINIVGNADWPKTLKMSGPIAGSLVAGPIDEAGYHAGF